MTTQDVILYFDLLQGLKIRVKVSGYVIIKLLGYDQLTISFPYLSKRSDCMGTLTLIFNYLVLLEILQDTTHFCLVLQVYRGHAILC